MPMARVCDPSPFGMWTRRTGGAWYVPDFARLSSDRRLSSRCAAYSSAVCPSTPVAPSLRVRRNASRSQSTSMWWESDVNAIAGACFASVAIRSSFVEMLVELGISVIFPSFDSVSRQPLPSTGSLGSVPPLHRLLRAARIPRRPRLRFVSFARLYRPRGRRRRGLPGSWGTISVRAPLSDPGGTATPDHRALALPLQRDDVAFRYFDGVGSHDTLLSGLNHAARTLAVYASQPPSPTVHARLASGWWSSLAGRESNPLGPFVKFQPVLYMASSSP